MAAIDRIQGHVAAPVAQQEVQNSTADKICQFLSRIEGIGTVFSILAGIAVAAIWGVQFGLLAAGIGGIVTFALVCCRSRESNPIPEVILDPANRLLAGERRGNIVLAEEAYFNQAIQFLDSVKSAIFRKSLHFNNGRGLCGYLDQIPGIDYTRLTLLSLHPVSFNGGNEGYEITLQSQNPQGWIRLYLPKRDEPGEAYETVRNPQRIEQVSPFLERDDVEDNHFWTLNLPFNDTMNLRLGIAVDFPQMDQSQVQLISTREVRYEALYGPGGIHVVQCEGFEVNLQTPNGPARYYADREGGHVASPAYARNIVPLNQM